MQGTLLLYFQVLKYFRCKNSISYQHIMLTILITIRQKTSQRTVWTPCWRSRQDMFDERSLLMVDCSAFGRKVNASNIRHEGVGCGVFLGRQFHAREILIYYYGTIVFSIPATQQPQACPKNVWWRRHVRHSRRFSTWTLKVPESFSNCTGKKKSAWVVPARFCCMWFINNSRNLPGDTFLEIQRRTQPREGNIYFLQIFTPDSASDLKYLQIIAD